MMRSFGIFFVVSLKAVEQTVELPLICSSVCSRISVGREDDLGALQMYCINEDFGDKSRYISDMDK